MYTGMFLGPLAIGGTLLVLVLGYQLFGLYGALLPCLLIVSSWLIGRPKTLLTVMWFVVLLVPSLEIIFGRELVRILEQVSGLLVLVVVVGHHILARVPPRGTRAFSLALILLLAVAATSGLVNRVPLVSLLFYTLAYGKFLWVFYAAVRFLRPADSRPVFWIMIASFALQWIFNLAFVAGVNPLPAILLRRPADSFIGTLASCNYVAYFMGTFLFLLVAVLREKRSFGMALALFPAAVVAVVQLLYTYTYHMYPILACCLWTQVVMMAKRAEHRILRAVVGVLLVLLVLHGMSVIGSSGELSNPLSMAVWDHNWDRLRTGPKWESYKEVVLNADRFLRYPLLGGGPGNYTSNIAMLTGRPLSRLPHLFHRYVAVDWQQESMGGSILSLPRTGILSLWGELGPIGCILFWGLHVYAVARIWRQRRQGLYTGLYDGVLADAFVPAMIFFIILNTLAEMVPVAHLTLGLWIWAGLLWHRPPPEPAPVAAAVVAPPAGVAEEEGESAPAST
jgi:hypothetical protein